eukprot:gene4961-5202_t
MGFLMFYLSQNPQWEERIRQEIREVLAGRSDMTAADIPKLVVTEACFREALRLHPPAAQIGRDAAHDTVLKERQWGGRFGDPNTFNPERFLPGAAESVGRHPHAYKPFGFGVRSCVGSQFALWEAKTLIPMLYHNFTFKLVGNLKLRPSSYNGLPPDNAVKFAKWLAAAGPDAAKGVLFAVFGVGNSQWVTYQAFPRLVQTQLLAAGGDRLMQLYSADAEEANFVEAIDDWTARVIPLLLKKFKVALPAGAAAAPAAGGQPVKPQFTLAPAAPGTPALHIKEIVAVEQLQASGTGRFTKHVELELPEGMSYSAGDHLEVLPRNSPLLVSTALQLLGLTEAFKLKAMASEKQYKQQVSGPKLTLLEVLSSFRSLLSVMDLVSLTGCLPRLAPRYYSISSSPAAGTRRQHLGAASSTIHNQKVGLNLGGTVRQLQSTFKLPADPTIPLIMVGPGTGVAPMIGFLEQREALAKTGTKLGPAILFFGCRDDGDFLYKSRLEAWLAAGVLTDLQVAFSRKAGQPKTYVQHLIKADDERLWHLLNSSPGARVYVCGDAKNMAPDVRATFVQVAQQVGGRSREAAERWLQDMREDALYLEDVWAS